MKHVLIIAKKILTTETKRKTRNIDLELIMMLCVLFVADLNSISHARISETWIRFFQK